MRTATGSSLKHSLQREAGGVWLGGLDSNQDNQIQNLMYCQLYDLPAGGNKKGRLRDPRYTLLSVPHFVNPSKGGQSSFPPAIFRFCAIQNEGKEKNLLIDVYGRLRFS